jgi:site-specific DNA-methyltransferase (adenine-specific)
VFGRNPYSLRSNFKDYSTKEIKGGIKLYLINHKHGYLPKNYKILKNANLLNQYKIIISKAIHVYASDPKTVANCYRNYPNKIFISEPNSVSIESYLVVKPKKSSKKICENIISYMKTKFFFFLLSVAKPSHNTNKDDFCYIPLQD